MFLDRLKGFICFVVVLVELTIAVYAAPSTSKEQSLLPHIPVNVDQIREGLPNDPSLVDRIPQVSSSVNPPIVFPMDEGEGGKMVKRGCCERTRHVVEAGYDDTRRRIGIDVGKCRKISKNSNERNRLTTERKTQCEQCPETSECIASELRMQRVYLVGEPKVFNVVQECECVHTPPLCERRSQMKIFFADTPYETAVDVGMCTGSCSHDELLGCSSTQNRTVTIDGPNGAHCVDVIETCECQQSCYRATHREVYYEVAFNETSNSTQTTIKEMDVGKCVGTCSKDTSLQCILRSPTDPEECLMSLVKKTNCSPQSYIQHNFQTTGNRRQTVLTINECGC